MRKGKREFLGESVFDEIDIVFFFKHLKNE